MPEENAEIAHKVIFRFADNPDTRPERAYRLIGLSASRPIDELAEENEKFERERSQQSFNVIAGGAA